MDTQFLTIFLDEGLDLMARWEEICLDLEKKPSKELNEALFRTAHNLKGSSRSVGLTEFGGVVHAIEDVVTLIRNGNLPVSSELIGFLLECQGVLKSWLESLRTDHTHVPEIRGILDRCQDYQRNKHGTPAASTQGGSASFGFFDEETVAAAAPEPVAPPQAAVTAASADGKATEDPAKSAAGKADETIRVTTGKLDSLIQMIGELAIQQSIISHARARGDTTSSTYINSLNLSVKITREAQILALALRMQPVKALFQRLERIARDVARTQGKKVEISVAGSDVELDKTVIEAITYPLVHIIRNSVDHGIESDAARSAAGKTAAAMISVNAVQDAGCVTITITDNGKGLDTARILAKARERGLIGESAQLSRQEIYNLLFLPGFSTAETVTDISGRGVGMDVVRRAVDELGGSIDLSSEVGHGTRTEITLPTSLAVIDALIVEMGPSTYAVPIANLEEIIDLTVARPMPAVDGAPVLELRGKILPLRRLESHLPGLPRPGKNTDLYTYKTALLVRSGPDRVAFAVDGIVRHQQVVVRPLSAKLAKLRGFSGGTVMPDGEPGLIIDLPVLIKDFLSGIKRKEAV